MPVAFTPVLSFSPHAGRQANCSLCRRFLIGLRIVGTMNLTGGTSHLALSLLHPTAFVHSHY